MYSNHINSRLDSNAHIEKQGHPQGYSWYGGELIANRPSRYSQEEQLEILNTHPFFTAVCPQCRHEFDNDNLPVHFDCPNCDFIDDSAIARAIAWVTIPKLFLSLQVPSTQYVSRFRSVNYGHKQNLKF